MGRDLKLEYLLDLEKKYNLYEDTIDGINYWNYLRCGIWHNYIVKEQLNLDAAHVGKVKWRQRIVIYFDLIKRAIFRGGYLKKNIDICFVLNSVNRKKVNGYFKSCFTSSLEKDFPDNVVLEYPYLLEHFMPVNNNNIIYLDYILLKQEISNRIYKKILKKRYHELEKKVKEKLDAPFRELQSILQLKLNVDKIEEEVVRQLINYKAIIKDIGKLIDKLRPKVVVEVCSYSSYCMMINEVCKKKNIRTIELQHGELSNHIAYKYFTEKTVAQLPDYIFLFSEFWKRQISLPIKEENLIVTGFPYFEENRKNIPANSRFKDGKRNILFLSQGPIGKKLSSLAIDLAQKLNKDEYRILYKLHPGETARYEEEYRKLEEHGIWVIYKEDDMLYDLFANSEAQVGVYTSAIFEGVGFGLNTYIYKIEMSEIMDELCNLGYARYVNNSEELYEYIMEEIAEKMTGDFFWKECAAENMKKAIEEIL